MDIGPTHIFHPAWIPHARFHAVWQLSVNTMLGILAVLLIWWPGPSPLRLRLARCRALSHSEASSWQRSRHLHGGTFSEPPGVPAYLSHPPGCRASTQSPRLRAGAADPARGSWPRALAATPRHGRLKGSGSCVALEVVQVLPHQELGPEAGEVWRSHLRQGAIDLVFENAHRAGGASQSARRHTVERVPAHKHEPCAQAQGHDDV